MLLVCPGSLNGLICKFLDGIRTVRLCEKNGKEWMKLLHCVKEITVDNGIYIYS